MITRLNSGRHNFFLRWSVGACALCVILLLLAPSRIDAQGDTRPRSPRYCRRCHEEAYAHWADSAHNREAFQGERFQSIWERQRQSPECLTCHTTQLDAGDIEVTYYAVTCDACHVEIGADYDPAKRDHVLMSIPESSWSCARCHGNDHALAYSEWEDSAHNGPREVGCLSCHDAHTGGLVEDDLTTLCGSCHMQPVPVVSAHMHIESGCTDCHPSPITMDSMHLSGDEPLADCVDCHMPVIMEQWGRYPASTGHVMTASLAACVNCHGELHSLNASGDPPPVE